jgi:hypothetical protein
MSDRSVPEVADAGAVQLLALAPSGTWTLTAPPQI